MPCSLGSPFCWAGKCWASPAASRRCAAHALAHTTESIPLRLCHTGNNAMHCMPQSEPGSVSMFCAGRLCAHRDILASDPISETRPHPTRAHAAQVNAGGWGAQGASQQPVQPRTTPPQGTHPFLGPYRCTGAESVLVGGIFQVGKRSNLGDQEDAAPALASEVLLPAGNTSSKGRRRETSVGKFSAMAIRLV